MYNQDEIIKKFISVHGNKYSYNNFVYKRLIDKSFITCPIHGDFLQSAHSHLKGQGCPKCGIKSRIVKKTMNNDQFIEKANKIHHGKYDYSNVKYEKSNKKVSVICPIHGEFLVRPNDHLMGRGCITCGNLRKGQAKKDTLESFIVKARDVHGNKYDYSKVEYVNSKVNISITCPIHGEFLQTPNNHLSGNGCPACGIHLSNGEKEIYNMAVSIFGENNVIKNDRCLLEGKELDIYIPSKGIAIEFDGLIWHSEYGKRGKDKHYHLNKTEKCKKKNVRLIHIFEDEFIEHKEIVINKLKHIFNFNTDAISIGARSCSIVKTDTKTAKDFLNKFHIQGFSSSTVYYAACYNNEIVSIMSFKKETKNSDNWELTRFATDINYRVNGAASKLFKHFVNDYRPLKVKSFLDRRWNTEGDTVYEKLGFEVDKILPPDYHYVKSSKRYHKFGFRKNTILKKYGTTYHLTDEMTESEMTKIIGFYKIWDCGLVRYVWKRNEEAI